MIRFARSLVSEDFSNWRRSSSVGFPHPPSNSIHQKKPRGNRRSQLIQLSPIDIIVLSQIFLLLVRLDAMEKYIPNKNHLRILVRGVTEWNKWRLDNPSV